MLIVNKALKVRSYNNSWYA